MSCPERSDRVVEVIRERLGDAYRVVLWSIEDALAAPEAPVIVIGSQKFRLEEDQFAASIRKIGLERISAAVVGAGDNADPFKFCKLKVGEQDFGFFTFVCEGSNVKINQNFWDCLKDIIESIAID